VLEYAGLFCGVEPAFARMNWSFRGGESGLLDQSDRGAGFSKSVALNQWGCTFRSVCVSAGPAEMPATAEYSS
jgi:hypothetical protein